MVVSRFRIIAHGYGDLTLDGAELEEVNSRRILGIILYSKLMFETHLQDVVSKTARSLEVVRRAGKLFGCPRVCTRELFQCVQLGVLCSLVDVVGGVSFGLAG